MSSDIEEIHQAKRRLRREVIRRIRKMTVPDRRKLERAIVDRFETLPGFGAASVVLLYVSHFPEEIDTRPLLHRALERKKSLICPRVQRDPWRLQLFRIHDLERDLVPGNLGIPEPRDGLEAIAPDRVDWVLVPGVAFDDRGARLGRGGGLYDRLLPLLRPEVPRWTIVLTPQWVDRVPIEPHDQLLDGILGADRTWSRPAEAPRSGAEGPGDPSILSNQNVKE